MGQDNKKRADIYACCAQEGIMGTAVEILEDEVGLHSDQVLVDKFIDNGYSGMDATRSEYQAMFQKCQMGEIDIVYVRRVSQLFRDTAARFVWNFSQKMGF